MGMRRVPWFRPPPQKAPLEIHVRFTGSLLTNEKLATIGIDLLLTPSVLESHIGVED
jgi:hypothetical protein